jgi:hypothetical protein
MDNKSSCQQSPQLFLGLTFIAAGIIFLFDNFGIARVESIWLWWPAILIVLGLTKLVETFSGPQTQ